MRQKAVVAESTSNDDETVVEEVVEIMPVEAEKEIPRVRFLNEKDEKRK